MTFLVGQIVTASDMNNLLPSGTVVQFGGTSAPPGWLICDGAAVSRTTFPALFSAIGTTYGAGDGSTTFNLPDKRGRVTVGWAAAGGHTDVATLGATDGTALANRRPKHRHTPHTHTGGNDTTATTGSGGSSNAVGSAGAATTGATAGGSGVGTDPLDAPAYIVLNHIIRT